MSVRLSIAALTLFIFTLGCQPDASTELPPVEPVAAETSVEVEAAPEKLVFDASCNTGKGTAPESQLRAKLAELSASPDNYQLVDYGSVDLEQSIIFGPQQKFKYVDNPELLEVKNFEPLLAQMTQAEFGKIKGTVDLGGRLYPRATVEEYLFRTEDCARVAEDYLTWSEDTAGSRGPLYKTVRGVVRNGQTIYHISSGGMYMLDRQDELEAVFKP